MYHHEIMRTVIDDRVRDRRAEATAERDARRVRRARELWAECAERLAARSPRRRKAVPAG